MGWAKGPGTRSLAGDLGGNLRGWPVSINQMEVRVGKYPGGEGIIEIQAWVVIGEEW